MSGKIDVANYENQLLLAKAKVKLMAALSANDGSPKSPVKEFAGLPTGTKSIDNVLNQREVELLDYISMDFKTLLAAGCGERSKANISHLDHIMSVSDALRCVDMGTLSFGGHIARKIKAPGPINGHNLIRPHEKIHSSHISAKDSANLIAKPKVLQHKKPFKPYFEPGDAGALSISRMTQNIHDYDIDLAKSAEKQLIDNEVAVFDAIHAIKITEIAKIKSKEAEQVKMMEETVKMSQIKDKIVTGDAVGLRYFQFDELLELPDAEQSLDVLYSASYLREKKKKIEEERKKRAAQDRREREQEEEELESQSIPQDKLQRRKHMRKRLHLWRYFLTSLHQSCDQVTIKEIEDLAYLKKPSEFIGNIIFYISILLGITPEWYAAKRVIFKNVKSFLCFLNAINPLDIPSRRIRKATALKAETVLVNLSVDMARRSCSTLPVLEHLAVWVLNFDTLARFIIAMEDRKEKLSEEIMLFRRDSGWKDDDFKREEEANTRKAMKSEKMDDIAQETARQTSLLDRARRKYKHSGIKLMDPTVELKSLLDEPAPTSPIQKKKVVIDYSKPRASANSAFKSPKPKPRPKLVVATDVTKNSAIKKTGPVIDTNFLMENFGATSRSLATAMGSVTAAATDFGSANDDFGYSEGKDESERKQESKTGGVDSSLSPIKTNSSAWAWDAKLRGISTTNPESVARFSKMAAASTNALNSLFIEDDDEVNADDKSKAKPQLEIEVEGKTQEDNAKEDDGYADEFNNYEDEFEFDAENPSHTPPVVISAVEKERQIKQEREQEEEEEKQRKIDSEREREDRRQARKRERDALRAVEEFRLTEVERLRKEEEAELKHRAIELEIQKEIERQKLNEIQRQDEERLEKIRLEERRNEREKEEDQTRELELEKKQREEKMKQQSEEQEKHEKIRERREKQRELELEQQKQDNERQAREKAVAAARDKAREIVGGANSPIKFIATSPIKATLSPASTPATLVMKTEPDEEGSDPYGFDDEWELDL